jgi:hypothetical protein
MLMACICLLGLCICCVLWVGGGELLAERVPRLDNSGGGLWKSRAYLDAGLRLAGGRIGLDFLCDLLSLASLPQLLSLFKYIVGTA